MLGCGGGDGDDDVGVAAAFALFLAFPSAEGIPVVFCCFLGRLGCDIRRLAPGRDLTGKRTGSDDPVLGWVPVLISKCSSVPGVIARRGGFSHLFVGYSVLEFSS